MDVSSIRVDEFQQDDFRSRESEQHIVLRRAPRAAFPAALDFWIVSEAGADWTGRESYRAAWIADALCDPLSGETADGRIASRLSGLTVPPTLVRGCIQGLHMRNDWDTEVVLATYVNGFASLTWETSA